MSDFKTFIENTRGKGIDDLAESVRKLPFFPLYVETVKQNHEISKDILGIHILLSQVADKDFFQLFMSVSTNITLSLLKQKFRSEFCQED